MTTPSVITYHHVQRSPRCLILYALALSCFVAAWLLRNHEPVERLPAVFATGVGCGFILLMTAAWNHYMIVADDGDRLLIRCGPIPWPLLRPILIRYEDIREVEVGRITVLEGYGFGMMDPKDLLVVLWGRDCVFIRGEKGQVRVGTDDAENLAAFLTTKIPTRPE